VLQGPREDSGFHSAVDPGVRLASQIYTYCKKFHPRTQVMASGLRTKDGKDAPQPQIAPQYRFAKVLASCVAPTSNHAVLQPVKNAAHY